MAHRMPLHVVKKPGFKIHIKTAIEERIHDVFGFTLLAHNKKLFINPIIKIGKVYRDFPLDYLHEDGVYSYLADNTIVEITYNGDIIPTKLCHFELQNEQIPIPNTPEF